MTDQTDPLMLKASQLKASMAKLKWPLFALAMTLFVAGMAYSLSQLSFSLSDLQWGPIAILGLVLVPITFLYGGANFVLMARGAGVQVSFSSSLKTACIAQFAEFLPLPGGAIVRSGALVAKGSSVLGAASHVTVNAVLWVGCAAIAAAISFGLDTPQGIIIAIAGLLTSGFCTIWLGRKAGVPIALAALAMRCAGLIIAGLRLVCAFLAIAVPMTLAQSYPFAFAAILGSASSLAPGGLGIGETIAALIAGFSDVAPTAAFLAVGLNRIVGLFISGAATAIIILTGNADTPSPKAAGT